MPKILEAVKVGDAYEVAQMQAMAPSRLRRLAAKAVGTAGVIGSAVVANSAFALTAAQDTAITDAYTATQGSVNNIIAGLLLVGLAITGFGIIWSLIRK